MSPSSHCNRHTPIAIDYGKTASFQFYENSSAVEPVVGSPLGSDAPQAHPSFDEFGYAPFARAIARAARTTASPKGLVMAIDGP